MARRNELLTDRQWAKIEPLLPRLPRRRQGGRPWADSRRVFEGILWVLKTGARWRDMPDRYPSGVTCWRRLKRWDEQGVWLGLWRAFLGELDERGRIRWSESFIDGSFAPAKKGAPELVQPRGGKARSGWWWATVRVFLSECPLPRPHQRKSRSSRPRSRRSGSRAGGRGGRGRSSGA